MSIVCAASVSAANGMSAICITIVQPRNVDPYRENSSARSRWMYSSRPSSEPANPSCPNTSAAGQVTVRLHGNDDDVQRKFNRTENVRPIPPTDPDFQRLYRRRNDAESINRALDDTLFLRRAHSIGHERQHLNLLTYALTVNSLALHRHGRRTGDPPDQLAA